MRVARPKPTPNLDVLFFVIHLCGEKCDSRAYVPLCDMIASDETFDVWFGETTTGTLAAILINLCDGDVEPLKRAIEAPEADEFARAAAMEALAYLVRAKGVLSDDEMRATSRVSPRKCSPARKIGSGRPGRSQSLSSATSRCAARSRASSRRDGSTLSRPRSTNSTRTYNWRETTRSAWPQFRRRASSRTDPASSCSNVGAMGKTTNGKGAEDHVDLAGDDLDIDADAPLAEDLPVRNGTPYLNPFRDVGRNDPCPCGSGKKYKKCCLAA